MSCDHYFDLSEGRGCVKCGFDPTAARVYQFQVERARRRPYADIGLTSLEAMCKILIERGDGDTLELVVKEVKRRRAALELAK